MIGYPENRSSGLYLQDIMKSLSKGANEVRFRARGIDYTGSYMLERSAEIRNSLIEKGLKPGDRCVFAASDDVGAMVAVFGILRAGGIVVGLPNFQSPSMWKRFIEDSSPSAAVVEDYLAERVIELAGLSSFEKGLVVIDAAGMVESPPAGRDRWADVDMPPESKVCIRYTSGSTGDPKGVVLTSKYMSEASRRTAMTFGDREGETFLLLTPPTEVVGYSMATTALIQGAATVIYSGKASPEGILMAIEEEGVHSLFLPPSQMVKLADSPALDFADVSSLRRIVYCGQSFFPEALDRARSKLGCELSQFYGQTETSMLTWLTPEDHESGDLSILGSAGRPVSAPRTLIEIRDPSTGRAVETGRVGHIFVKSDITAKEMWSHSEKRFEKDGWWDTEDLGSFDDRGYLTIKGRDRDMILYRAYTIFCKDVEERLMECEGVKEAAVHAVSDKEDGEHVFAWIVPSDSSRIPSVSDMDKHVEESLGPWYRPSHYEVIEALPTKSALDKVDKIVLRERAEKILTSME